MITIASVRSMEVMDSTVARLSEGMYLSRYELKIGTRVNPNVNATTIPYHQRQRLRCAEQEKGRASQHAAPGQQPALGAQPCHALDAARHLAVTHAVPGVQVEQSLVAERQEDVGEGDAGGSTAQVVAAFLAARDLHQPGPVQPGQKPSHHDRVGIDAAGNGIGRSAGVPVLLREHGARRHRVHRDREDRRAVHGTSIITRWLYLQWPAVPGWQAPHLCVRAERRVTV